MKTIKQIRDSFWNAFPEFTRIKGYSQNDYCTDIRCSFVDYVDYLHRDGQINDKLANDVTL